MGLLGSTPAKSPMQTLAAQIRADQPGVLRLVHPWGRQLCPSPATSYLSPTPSRLLPSQVLMLANLSQHGDSLPVALGGITGLARDFALAQCLLH